MQLSYVDEQHKAELLRQKELCNPVVLNYELNEAAEEILRVNEQKVYGTGTALYMLDMATAI